MHFLFVICSLLIASIYGNPVYQFDIDFDMRSTYEVPKRWASAGIEFLNHEIQGALYSQMIFGESFEELAPDSITRRFNVSRFGPRTSLYGYTGCGGRFNDEWGLRDVSKMWHGEAAGTANGTFELVEGGSMNGLLYQTIKFTHGRGSMGVANYGTNCHGGTHFVEKKPYEGYMYIKGRKGTKAYACIQSQDGFTKQWSNLAECRTLEVQKENTWEKVDLRFTPNATTECGNFLMDSQLWTCNGRFIVELRTHGEISLDYTWLTPGDWNLAGKGIPARKDIMDNLALEGLGTLRMGGSMCNEADYRWKRFRGKREDRQPYHGFWYSTLGTIATSRGFGMFEIIDASRAVGIEPIITFNNLEWASDMGDFVEYCWGDEHTTWGRKRHEDGHPRPYNVSWIEIGNEQPLDWVLHDTFTAIVKAMEERISKIKGAPRFKYTIGHNLWLQDMNDPLVQTMMKSTNHLGDRVFWDLHIGTGANAQDGYTLLEVFEGFRTQLQKADSRMRIIILEENGGDHGIGRAVGHALYGNVMLRNADLVVGHGYADCLEFWQGLDHEYAFNQGQLFVTADKSFGAPVWWEIYMSSQHTYPHVVETDMHPGNEGKQNVYYPDGTTLLSRDGKHLVVRVTNTDPKNETSIMINLHGVLEQRETISPSFFCVRPCRGRAGLLPGPARLHYSGLGLAYPTMGVNIKFL
eukprot:TRINITY_DN66158_c5_g11_i1.p1 TRINITY_DN66158_c5_g11~~TRINITY_DN66158_c5_g11_i1.p1  ORF type:complete len:692 (-),score=55.57 TRINITY_DN66158_c5_g11_i1:25-2100(-)